MEDHPLGRKRDRDHALHAVGPEAEGRPFQPHGEGLPPSGARGHHHPHRPAGAPLHRGHEPLAAELGDKLWCELFRNTGPEFIEAKLVERAERHSGRAASAMCWSRTSRKARAGCATCRRSTGSGSTCTGCRRPKGWSLRGFCRREEFDSFARAEEFLWAVRCHLHYITGARHRQLTFDLQVEVAERMGYRDTAGRRAVEHFMQDYFRHATTRGRADPHLPDPARGAPRQARGGLVRYLPRASG